jgi:hypothetical protein
MPDRIITEEQIARTRDAIVAFANIALTATQALAGPSQALVNELQGLPAVPEPPETAKPFDDGR